MLPTSEVKGVTPWLLVTESMEMKWFYSHPEDVSEILSLFLSFLYLKQVKYFHLTKYLFMALALCICIYKKTSYSSLGYLTHPTMNAVRWNAV